MASGLAGTAAVSNRRGTLLLVASPSKASRSSLMRLRNEARSSAPLIGAKYQANNSVNNVQ